MSRYIDSLPTPDHVEPKKFIVLSAPRTGTFGLYSALKILGFKPYHMAEVLSTGPTAVKMMLDGFEGERGNQKPYTRKEFDKWFADYDVIIEMPFFMLQSTISAYPDAKFILVERSPEKWTKSVMNTIGATQAQIRSFPQNLMACFDDMSWQFWRFGAVCSEMLTKGEGFNERGRRHITDHYKEYIATVKRSVPPGQLKVFNLEDGFGWQEICPVVGKSVPDVEWPGRNTPDEFHQFRRPLLIKAAAKTILGMSTIVGTVVTAGMWYGVLPKMSFF